MFHKIFKRNFYNKLHSNAPYPKERLLYLDYWQKHGSSLLRLQKIASILLVAANCLDIDSKKMITIAEISKTFKQFSRQPRNHKKREMVLNSQTRKIYPYHVKKWLKMIGKLDNTTKIDYPFSKQLLSFENYQRNERRLAEISINTSSFILKIFLKYISKKNIFLEIFTRKMLMISSFMKEWQIILGELLKTAQQQSAAF
jgi:hypothetical protein